jgi:hypothetical protein
MLFAADGAGVEAVPPENKSYRVVARCARRKFYIFNGLVRRDRLKKAMYDTEISSGIWNNGELMPFGWPWYFHP